MAKSAGKLYYAAGKKSKINKKNLHPSKHQLIFKKVSLLKVLVNKCSINFQLLSASCVIQLF